MGANLVTKLSGVRTLLGFGSSISGTHCIRTDAEKCYFITDRLETWGEIDDNSLVGWIFDSPWL